MVVTQLFASFWNMSNSGSSRRTGHGWAACESVEIANGKQLSWWESCMKKDLSSLRCSDELASRSCEAARFNTMLMSCKAGKMVGASSDIDAVSSLMSTQSCAMVRGRVVPLFGAKPEESAITISVYVVVAALTPVRFMHKEAWTAFLGGAYVGRVLEPECRPWEV